MSTYMNSQNAAFNFASTVARINQALPEPQEICCDDTQPEAEKAHTSVWRTALHGLEDLPLSVTTPMMQGFRMGRF